MRGNGLRSRLFQAIGVVVLICVAFTIGVGLVLTQRAVKRATLQRPRTPGRPDRCVSGVRSAGAASHAEAPADSHRTQHERSRSTGAAPAGVGAEGSSGTSEPVQGTIRSGRHTTSRAATANPGTLILLRPAEHRELAPVAVRAGACSSRLPPEACSPRSRRSSWRGASRGPSTGSRRRRARSRAARIPEPVPVEGADRDRDAGRRVQRPRLAAPAERRRRSGTSSSRSATS